VGAKVSSAKMAGEVLTSEDARVAFSSVSDL
jgi:hypothetical protein